MGDFFAELRRRHIYRIGAGYVVVAWGIAQLIDFLSQVWELPAWIAQPVTVVLAIGLPVTLVIAWLIEGKAHEAVASAVRSPATTVDWILTSAVVGLIAITGYQQFVPVPENSSVALVDEQAAEPTNEFPNSIAVLPLVNLSPDPDNAFFADAIHGELLTQLSKITSLKVISRTSVMGYRDTSLNMRDIGQELGVANIFDA